MPRKSQAELSVVIPLRTGRPLAPSDLTEIEREEWRAIVSTMPANWFARESHAALAALCRHSCRARVLGAQVAKIEANCLKTEDGIRILDKLLAMLERESRAIIALMRTMRLTQQARVDKRTAGRQAINEPGGSYYDTMELDDDE